MSHPRAGSIGFLFAVGHGHYTQYLNFQECIPPEQRDRAEWIALDGYKSGDRVAGWGWVPGGIRWRRNQLWHARTGLARRADWGALFIAGAQIRFLPFIRRYPTYLYTDLSRSLKEELAPWYNHQLTGSPVKRAAKDWMDRRMFHSSRGVFTMSRWAAEGIRRDYGMPAENVHVVLPGANLKRWPFIDRGDRGSGPVRILMVGGQFRLKGGETMLQWAEKTKLTGWQLDVVTWPGELPAWVRETLGNPGAFDKVDASLAPRLPNVRIHCGLKANTPELMALYRDADVFCLPTQADGSSIASLEAMASGLPVLVGGVGGIPELIDDGVTGMLLKRSDQQDLETKLEALIADAGLRRAMGSAARRSCEEYYNVERQIREILAVMDGAAAWAARPGGTASAEGSRGGRAGEEVGV